MEDYEQFCLRSLARLQVEGQAVGTGGRKPSCAQEGVSIIRFHGRTVLSPLLTEEQRREMADHRQRAVQLELDTRSVQRSKLLARVQHILDHVQMHKVPDMEIEMQPPTPRYCRSPNPEAANGYALLIASPVLPRGGGVQEVVGERFGAPCPSPLNGPRGGEGQAEERRAVREEEEEERGGSPQSLLRRSGEWVERERGRRGSKGGGRVTRTPPPLAPPPPPPPESLSDKENEGRSPQGDTGAERQSQYQAASDPCARHRPPPSPEPSLSPRPPHERRPRPVSAGNIHIPVGPADLGGRSHGWEGGAMAAWAEAGLRSPDQRGLETGGPVSVAAGYDIVGSGFRRRCHTLDSQLHPSSPSPSSPSSSPTAAIDRSQERLPRFMAGVARLAPSRRPAAAALALNQSYEVENPTPSLARPRVTSDLSPGRLTPAALGQSLEGQDSKTEEARRRVQALEDMQRRLEEEHAAQMSALIAEQEKEQHRLRQELEDKERTLREQGIGRRSATDSYSALSPSYPVLSPAHSPAERSPGHSMKSRGFPSPLLSGVSSPAVQPSVYLGTSTWGGSKSWRRLSQGTTPEQQRALCRLGAITRGFLTRRLLKIEKVKHLRQTVQDTQEFIRSFQTEAPQKRGSITSQDVSLQERVGAQLRAALYDVHDMFFVVPLEERLALLRQDRELRTERRLREMEKAKSPKDRMTLSAATQRSLDRKKRVGESPGQARKTQQKPKSPPADRILKPSQGQNAPVPGQLNRQGSWYRKTPEERARHSDSLKKQHSLG